MNIVVYGPKEWQFIYMQAAGQSLILHPATSVFELRKLSLLYGIQGVNRICFFKLCDFLHLGSRQASLFQFFALQLFLPTYPFTTI